MKEYKKKGLFQYSQKTQFDYYSEISDFPEDKICYKPMMNKLKLKCMI